MMKYLFIGRTASGKDALANELMHHYNWTFVKSYTTRAKRSETEDSHIFITKEQASSIKDKLAITHIQNETLDEYFATKDQIMQADAYIVDPRGAEQVLSSLPDEIFTCVYIQATDDARLKAAIQRSQDQDKATEIFEKRNASEKEEFDNFDEQIKKGKFKHLNCPTTIMLENDYTPSWLEQQAHILNKTRRCAQALTDIIYDLSYENILNTDENNLIPVDMPDGSKQNLTLEQLAACAQTSDKGLGTYARAWLELPSTHIINTSRTNTKLDLTLKQIVFQISEKIHADLTEQNLINIISSIEEHPSLLENFCNAVQTIIKEEIHT